MRPYNELCEKLKAIPGVKAVYYMPPENLKMVYPCIRVKLAKDKPIYASNRIHINTNRYTVTLITTDPISSIPDAIRDIGYCSFDTTYTSGNLNHYVYTIFY